MKSHLVQPLWLGAEPYGAIREDFYFAPRKGNEVKHVLKNTANDGEVGGRGTNP